MSVGMTEVSATGIRSLAAAMDAAVGFSEIFPDTTYAVVHCESERVFDVEAAYPADRVGSFGVVALVRNGSEL